MTSALALCESETQAVIRLPERLVDRHSTIDASDVSSFLVGFQLATGQYQRLHQVTQPAPASLRFDLLWKKATDQGSESVWHLLPEEMFDLVEEEKLAIDERDARFLGFAAVSPNMPNPAAIAAIRLLGMLAEEEALSQSQVLPILRDVLGHDDAQRRYYAAKALWQARAREGLTSMRRRLKREPHEEVRAILHRAIAVLE